MTANQVAALKAQEEMRHNLATEEQAKKDLGVKEYEVKEKYAIERERLPSEIAKNRSATVSNFAKGIKDLVSPFALF